MDVASARGPISPDLLGRTLMHEHVFVLTAELQNNYPGRWDEAARVSDAVQRLNRLKTAGIDTLVDLTILGQGRDVRRIKEVAAQTELNILVATGYYTFDSLPPYFRWHAAGSGPGGTDPLTDMFIADIVQGVGETGVRAAMVKGVTDAAGITADVNRALHCVADAHRATGVPITTHSHAATRRGLEQQRLFEQAGVDLTRVVIGHHGDSTDIAYLEEILAGGSYLGMDRFGIDFMLSFEQRVETVATLCQRGHHDQIVLSHDAACYMDWFVDGSMSTRIPNWHFEHISNDVLPALRARGVSDEQITTMMVDNPRRILNHDGPY